MPMPLILWSNLQAVVAKAQAQHVWLRLACPCCWQAELPWSARQTFVPQAEADVHKRSPHVTQRAWTAAIRNSQQRSKPEVTLHLTQTHRRTHCNALRRSRCCLGMQAERTLCMSGKCGRSLQGKTSLSPQGLVRSYHKAASSPVLRGKLTWSTPSDAKVLDTHPATAASIILRWEAPTNNVFMASAGS